MRVHYRGILDAMLDEKAAIGTGEVSAAQRIGDHLHTLALTDWLWRRDISCLRGGECRGKDRHFYVMYRKMEKDLSLTVSWKSFYLGQYLGILNQRT